MSSYTDCSYYRIIGNKYVCFGAKGMPECYCNGDRTKCSFYTPEKYITNREYLASLSNKKLIDWLNMPYRADNS